MDCPFCGKENPPDRTLCESCGRDLGTPDRGVIDPPDRVGEDIRFHKGEIIGGKYEVLEEIGRGKFAVVYRVRHTKVREEVALKLIRPRMLRHELDLKKFTDMIGEVKRLDHPGIVKYFDVGEEGGTKFYTCELVDGISLRRYMDNLKKEGKTFPVKDALTITKNILEILTYAHETTIHRDLTPENIILLHPIDPSFPLKITDWGIAKLGDSTVLAESKTAPSPYSAPEFHGFRGEATRSSDLYSVSAILYEMLMGEALTGSFTYPTKAREDATDKIDDIIELGLTLDRDEEGNPLRFQTAEVMLENVRMTLEELPFGRFRLPVSKWVFIILGVVVVLILGVRYYLSSTMFPDQEDITKRNILHRTRLRMDVAKGAERALPVNSESLEAAAPEGMVYIPPGPFISGYFQGETLYSPGEKQEDTVETKGFYMDIHEFPEPGKETPFTKVTWLEAKKICNERGKRLCTATEWEKACKGPNNLIYPYGDYYAKDTCPPYPRDAAYEIRQYPDCLSGYGVHNLGGGAWEWTEDSPSMSPNRKIVKGGEKGNPKKGTRCSFIKDDNIQFSDYNIGFRCCMDAD